MGERPGREQRQHPRIPVRQRCWCEGEEITVFTQMGNISEGGLYLRTQAPLLPGDRVRVQLRDGEGELELGAAVVWRLPPGRAPDAEPGVGLRFDRDDADRAAALHRHVRQLRGAG
jgi:uncharacterized protein (TIGR02266 family)